MLYPDKLDLALTPTPLQPMRRLQADMGGPLIWIKRDDLTGSAVAGNKIRKLEFIAAKALSQNCQALITCGGTQSNHCRATAVVAAQLGLKCHLILRDDSAARSDGDGPLEMAGNRLLDHLCGAEISVHKPSAYFSQLDRLFTEVVDGYAAEGIKALSIPTGGSDATGVWGYFAACEELAADFEQHGIEPGAIVCATGSGGTQAGLVAGAHYHNLQADIYGVNVCDDERWFQQKVASDLAAWQAEYSQAHKVFADLKPSVNVIDGYVGKGYGRLNVDVVKTIRLLARKEGVFLDPVYTGKAFHGLLTEIAKGRFAENEDIVFVHTGGIFGLFPYAHSLLESEPPT